MWLSSVGVSLLTIILFTNMVFAGWQDDWLANKTASGPQYLGLGNRGYFSAGSFSARWPQSNDHLFDIQLPKVKMGCGGIDGFLGSIGFLSLDMLVQKFQRILAAAPAAAFDIALKTLAPQVSETIKALESIADKLNGISLDDCKASKALVATLADTAGDAFGLGGDYKERLDSETSTAQSQFLVSSGVNDLYDTYKRSVDRIEKTWSPTISGVGGAGNISDKASNEMIQASMGSTQGCSDTMKRLFSDGSLLGNLMGYTDLNADHIALIRGYVGDVWIVTPIKSGNNYVAMQIPVCSKNKDIESFFTGDSEVRSAIDAECTPDTSPNRNLYVYVTGQLSSIAMSLKNNTPLTDTQREFLKLVPITVLPILKTAVATHNDDTIIGQLAEPVAKLYAYAMLNDIFVRASSMVRHASQIIDRNRSEVTTGQTCDPKMYANVIASVTSFDETLRQKMVDVRDSLATSVHQLTMMQNMVNNYRVTSDLVNTELKNMFGPTVARRYGNS